MLPGLRSPVGEANGVCPSVRAREKKTQGSYSRSLFKPLGFLILWVRSESLSQLRLKFDPGEGEGKVLLSCKPKVRCAAEMSLWY